MDGCTWCLCNEKMKKYHDEEWGVPLHDDHRQFEFLMMEVMQCGLNWNMMIQKREIFRQCFDGFDYDKIASYEEEDIERILSCEGMIKSRRKVEAVIHNAGCFQKVRQEYGSFSLYIWGVFRGKDHSLRRPSKGKNPGPERPVPAAQPGFEETRFQVPGSGHGLLPSPGLRGD